MAGTFKKNGHQEQHISRENEIEDEDENDGPSSFNNDEFHAMHLEPRPFRPFKTSEEYLYAMKEDLAEWLNNLYGIEISVDSFFEILETGTHLCQHANNILHRAREYKEKNMTNLTINIPEREVVYRRDVLPGTFKARDNISNFISWCRALSIKECLLFETDDLVMRKNERSFILCLLEVARYGARFGMPAPVLVQMEQEIDAEIEDSDEQRHDPDHYNHEPMTRSFQTQEQRMLQLMGLHERVVNLLNRCTCPSQFPMIKVADGKYRIGDTRVLIFVRILRNHVMVRVGGGWDTLEHYLDKHDPCRCRSGHRFSTSARLSMSSGKGGSTNMAVTYNRPTQNETPQMRNSPSHTQYAMENAPEYNTDYALHPGRKSHDFSSTPSSNSYQFNSARKPRSRSFDNAANQLSNQEESSYAPPNSFYKRFPPAKGLRKENSDPSSFMEKAIGASPEINSATPPRSYAVTHRKSPLLPSCPNKIPLQKSASKSKIPHLDQPLQKAPKSQSTEDLFRTKYYLGVDDRWMRSRSSSSSPVHGTPRSTSMEHCNLSAITGIPSKGQIRRSSMHEQQVSPFIRNQPGQYSFRSPKKSPELRRKNDLSNKTWSFHHRTQRSPIYQDWVNTGNKNSTVITGNSPTRNVTPHSINTKQTRFQKSPSRSPEGNSLKSEIDDNDDLKSNEIMKNLEMIIDRMDRKSDVCAQNEAFDRNCIDSKQVIENGSNGGATKGDGNSSYSAKNRLNRESPPGSRIPVLQWK